MYESAFCEGKEMLNIEDIVADTAMYAKASGFIKDMGSVTYASKLEYDENMKKYGEKWSFVPKTRLDVNLIYWRLLGDEVIERNQNFETYSVQALPVQDIEDSADPKKEQLKLFVTDLLTRSFDDEKTYRKAMMLTMRKFHMGPNKLALQKMYMYLRKQGKVASHPGYEAYGVKKGVRSNSGVLVVTVLTSPYPDSEGQTGRFDCAYDCAYCPSEPGMPRSYISTEPAVRRAISNNWDPIEQFVDRVSMLAECGHVVDKIEILVLGGTWSSYPLDYRANFVRDLFFAANTKAFLPPDQRTIRPKQSLSEERELNESSDIRIIGVTLETRPDCINKTEIKHLRECGCTRVQLGVQHTDQDVLDKINRRCTPKHNIRGIRMLKDAGFKVDIHLMPDLPGSNPEKDKEMFDQVLTDPDLQADQWKIYPTSVVKHSLIEKWYNEGSYVPYADTDNGDLLVDVVCYVKAKVHPWIRLNRVIRDIPEISIYGGNANTNMRQKLEKIMKEKGTPCNCIRCREVRDQKGKEEAELVVRKYDANQGTEYFISFESPEIKDEAGLLKSVRQGYIMAAVVLLWSVLSQYWMEDQKLFWLMQAVCMVIAASGAYLSVTSNKELAKKREKGYRREIIYGFTRLRINGDPSVNIFPELQGAGLIRELHVYGRLISHQDKNAHSGRTQHAGFGRRLLEKASEITKSHGLKKIAVISGDGVKEYYRHRGFTTEGQYLTKYDL